MKCLAKTYQFWMLLCVLFIVPFSALADTLKVAAGWARPPYIIPANHSGFELDLVRQVVENMGHTAEFIYAPYERTIGLLQENKADLALTVNSHSGIPKSLLSSVYVVYQNVAISLKKNNIALDKIEDLKQRSVVAFQGAADVLGDTFVHTMEGNNLYVEMADQLHQIELFFQGEIEVIIMDVNVFNALSNSLMTSEQIKQVTLHSLFPANRYSVGFNDIALKTQFNNALAEFITKNDYQQLKRLYNMQAFIPKP